ncbi:ribokinase [Clostridium sp. AF18-27]|uniref:Ribokinase n=2 Tax=Enterocloster lavalensis TaxID=460384 RepID=A0A1I0F0P5_9FIRM|nr:PfkB family carbohydrate kinase [Enterocloster lavalensis]RHR56021.1 ribokinase [Clostridium sp. AF18-27]SET51200.1 ribokinase [Enterocloster lavalensis]
MGKNGKKIDVIVLNSHGVGQICHVKRLPRRGETMEATHWRVEEDGGKGATVSVALGRLGVSTGYIGKVGYDPWGDMGDQWMSESGVDTTFMYRDHSVSTGTGLIMVDEDGLNTIVDGDSACAALTWDETHAAIEAMKEAQVFITGFGMPFKKALDGAKIAKEEFGMLTLCNTSPLPSEPMGDLSYLDFIVLNDIEARVLCGLPEDSDKPYEQMLRQIRDEYHTRGVIMTCGEDGSAVLDGEEFWTVAPTPVKAVDTIGAGDGYLAAVAAGLVWGKNLKEATQWASKYAAYKVTRKGSMTRKPGMGYPELAEVEAFMEAHP